MNEDNILCFNSMDEIIKYQKDHSGLNNDAYTHWLLFEFPEIDKIEKQYPILDLEVNLKTLDNLTIDNFFDNSIFNIHGQYVMYNFNTIALSYSVEKIYDNTLQNEYIMDWRNKYCEKPQNMYVEKPQNMYQHNLFDVNKLYGLAFQGEFWRYGCAWDIVDLFGDVVYWPLWWYSKGLLQTAFFCLGDDEPH